MNTTDVFFILRWWTMFAIIGIVFFPVAARVFSSFFDRGYIFAKIIGIILISYIIFFLGSFHIIPFTFTNICIVFTCIVGIIVFFVRKDTTFSLIKMYWQIILFQEILFLLCLFFWAYIRSYAPEIHGLEKYMDFGFVNSILRTEYFPPKDMWFTPYSINYYYFGHLVTAVLTKLSGIPSFITYNLTIASLFALSFTASFSIGANAAYLFLHKKNISLIKTIFIGLLTALLVTFSGNLHIHYAFFEQYQNEKPLPIIGKECITYNESSKDNSECVKKSETKQLLTFRPDSFPNSYWYPNATRFIYNTIHEFPLYSWVVADLHGHVLDVPFVLLTIAVFLSLFTIYTHTSFNQKPVKQTQDFISLFFNYIAPIRLFHCLFVGFLLAVLYMTNAWDGLIYLLLTSILLFSLYVFYQKQGGTFRIFHSLLQTSVCVGIIMLSFFLTSLPFSLHFNPSAIVSGIGILCAPKALLAKDLVISNGQQTTTYIAKSIGPFLFEPDHCQRSPFWQLLILYGFFYFFALAFFLFLYKQKQKLFIDFFILLLIGMGTLLIIIPEFIYVKDIYPAHYRANTMFKLVFQAFILLSISSAYIIGRILFNIRFLTLTIGKKLIAICFILCALLLLYLIGLYPQLAISSYYGVFSPTKSPVPPPKKQLTLDGIKYLKNSYPSDYEAIVWLNKTIQGQPVILEAQGDSYTDFARVSSNTGLPTVLGWTVHEWLWRGSYDIPSPRIEEVKTLYETTDMQITKTLIAKYAIKFIFVGSLEREKYALLNEKKFEEFGKIVYQKGDTRIYSITQ